MVRGCIRLAVLHQQLVLRGNEASEQAGALDDENL